MKKLTIVLPLAILLAYCSGPNNTQTTDTEMNDPAGVASTSGTTSTNSTLANNTATTYDEIYKVNQTTGGTATTTDTGITSSSATETTTMATTTTGTTTIGTTTTDNRDLGATDVIPSDTTDPMYQHWQRTNARHWTWDMDYPGYDRPVAGTYNSAINGSWQLVMTPELASAWLPDNSRSLWLGSGDTYLSASESFNNRDVSGSANLNNNINASGSLNSGLNNNASANAATANQLNAGTTTGTVSGSAGVSGTTGTTGVTSGTTGTVSGTAGITDSSAATTGISANVDGSLGTTGTVDVNSISYNAYNGNMYQMPKFNLYLDNGSFTGYTGCNGISGRVEVTGTGLRFLNTTPGTDIDCLGGFDENVLLDMLRRVDSYAYVGDELQLLQGNQVLLRFRKNGDDTSLK